MGRSIKHAAEVIERYVALSPQMTDGLAAMLAEADATTCKMGCKMAKQIMLKQWSGREDSNLRPTVPKTVALPGCATPRTRSS